MSPIRQISQLRIFGIMSCYSDFPERRIPFSAFLLLTTLLFATGCDQKSPSANSQDGTRQTTLALNWYPEAEHGGFVAADGLGLFQDRKLAVEIIPGGSTAPNLVIQELAAGRIEFAVSTADQVVTARGRGVPIVAVLAPIQQTPRCIMVHESSGISSLQELKNVELAISEARPFALWMKKQLPLTGVTMIPYNGLVGEFLLKPDFAQQGYVFSEPFVAREKGGDPKVLMLSEIGFNPYASLLVTTEDVINAKPELVRDLVIACQQGWQQYLESPEATNQRLNLENKEISIEALQYAVDSLRPLCRTADGEVFGSMTTERWQQLVEQIEAVQVVEAGSVKAADCFTNRFLESAP
ncbi:MAG: ABC transporter substrate-binding protein [Planctomycetaceae bacterium]